jgi:hypothetical protein
MTVFYRPEISRLDNKEQTDAPANPNPNAAQAPSAEQFRFASDAILERFASSFESSARRWEFIVYPSLFAFVVLAGYGFFLVYSLTKDMHTLAAHVDPEMTQNMGTMATNIQELSSHIADMSDNVQVMTVTLGSMLENLQSMDATLTPMQSDIAGMNVNMTTITTSVQEVAFKLNAVEPMRLEMQAMNAHMARISFDMNKFTRPESLMPFFR